MREEGSRPRVRSACRSIWRPTRASGLEESSLRAYCGSRSPEWCGTERSALGIMAQDNSGFFKLAAHAKRFDCFDYRCRLLSPGSVATLLRNQLVGVALAFKRPRLSWLYRRTPAGGRSNLLLRSDLGSGTPRQHRGRRRKTLEQTFLIHPSKSKTPSRARGLVPIDH